MINQQLIDPASIVVVGASNNIAKPGGKIFHNIRTGNFSGKLYAVNPREEQIQGLPSRSHVSELPDTDLAILAIPAAGCVDVVRELAETRATRAFIIISAGFGEESREGATIERLLVEICRKNDAVLIGPNCIGVMTPAYQGVFTLPIPKLDPAGCDFISGSGATAVFIMESGLQKGLRFNHVFSVGNSAMVGVEDVLQYFDETYRSGESSRVKILYFETIRHPGKLLKHATSLISKGCSIAAIKAGTTGAGSRAASSHTGAMASSDMAVDALFRKAGIVRCYGREELTTVASVMLHPMPKGGNMAIITHAGGPAVMMTDVLAGGGMDVPRLEGPEVERLLTHLFPGSSASNPIDLLATGNAEQVGTAIDFCENSFPEIDGIVVIFGTPGLAPVFDVYEVLHRKMHSCSKPIYPVLPSVITASQEVEDFIAKGHINFPDEVLLGKALTRIIRTVRPVKQEPAREENRKIPGEENRTIPGEEDRMSIREDDRMSIREVMDTAADGYLSPGATRRLLLAAGIPVVEEGCAEDEAALWKLAQRIGFPLVMKVVGPVHKTDAGGVALGISNDVEMMDHFVRMQGIEGFRGVLLQPMIEGMELFAGASHENGFGHLVMCGMGGIYVESLRDFATGLAPLEMREAEEMIRSLKSYGIMKGSRGHRGIDTEAFARILVRLSLMLEISREIAELDLNPIMGNEDSLLVVDARIRIQKSVV